MSLTSRVSTGIALAALALALAGTPVLAQATGCGELQTHLGQRQSIAQKLQAGGKKQLDAKVACAGFNQLVQNGVTLLKWTDTNKEWCQIPDAFIESIRTDHGKAQAIRAKACGVAAKQVEIERQAKSGGGAPGTGGLLGGGGLSGSSSLPQGAL